jgi:hypothetical protein
VTEALDQQSLFFPTEKKPYEFEGQQVGFVLVSVRQDQTQAALYILYAGRITLYTFLTRFGYKLGSMQSACRAVDSGV